MISLHTADSLARRGTRRNGTWLHAMPWLALLLTLLLGLALGLCSGPQRAPGPDGMPFPLAAAAQCGHAGPAAGLPSVAP
jgi:hypothetical protein